MHWRTSSFFCN